MARSTESIIDTPSITFPMKMAENISPVPGKRTGIMSKVRRKNSPRPLSNPATASLPSTLALVMGNDYGALSQPVQLSQKAFYSHPGKAVFLERLSCNEGRFRVIGHHVVCVGNQFPHAFHRPFGEPVIQMAFVPHNAMPLS